MDIEHLKSALDALIKDPSLFQKPDGTTFCNIAVHRIAALYDIKEFPLNAHGDPPMANRMCEIAATSPAFESASGEGANAAALAGKFVLAAHGYAGHGHVAVVYPSPEMFYSPSWKKEVPFVANVGKRNAIIPASEAFPVALGEPGYYIHVSQAA